MSLTCLHCLGKTVSINVLIILIPSIFLHVPFNSFLNRILVLLSSIFVDLFSILHFVKFSSRLYLSTLSNVISKLSQRFSGIWAFETLMKLLGILPRKYMMHSDINLAYVFIESLKATCGSLRGLQFRWGLRIDA